MLSKSFFSEVFSQNFAFTPTGSQAVAMEFLSSFICESAGRQLFILKGYAGTGKTTLVSALVKTLVAMSQKSVLLAPTGRAAKVFSVYASEKAYTIHKHLYRVRLNEGILEFNRKENKSKNTLYIVDEVSMIADFNVGGSDLFSVRSLLEDLIQYTFEGENCKLLFIGDDAQLPPVGAAESPALMVDYLKQNFSVEVNSYQLTDVVRQATDSGILFNANRLRTEIVQPCSLNALFAEKDFRDFVRIDGIDLQEELNNLYSKYEIDDIVTITRSNKRAYIFNQEIRNRVLYRENAVSTGDFLMAVKNNYYWVDEASEVGFIANGDIMEVMSIRKVQEMYGFHFADVTVRLCDYPNYPNIDIKIILESLESEGASLTREQMNNLYQEVSQDYQEIASKRLRYLKIKNDPYLNAVQVKFSYALTCHKTQGGQWPVVLIDQGIANLESLDKEYLRWLYTALTRATEKVYLINFKDEFFEKGESL